MSSPAGQFASVSGVVKVADGQLNLQLRNNARANALVITPVQAPSGLEVAGTTLLPDPSVTLTWEPVAGAEGYRVYRSGDGAAVAPHLAEATVRAATPAAGLRWGMCGRLRVWDGMDPVTGKEC